MDKTTKEEGEELLNNLLGISLKDAETKEDINYWADGIKEYQKELKEMFTKDLYAKKLYKENEKLLNFLNQLKKEL